MNMLRQISEPQFRFMGIVSDGGVAPNIIPEMASATIWVRYFADETKLGSVSPKKQGELIDAKVEQLKNIARGAALATNCKVDIDLYGTYVPGISVGAFNDLAFQYAIEYGGVNVKEKPKPADNGGWDETGMASNPSSGDAGVDRRGRMPFGCNARPLHGECKDHHYRTGAQGTDPDRQSNGSNRLTACAGPRDAEEGKGRV